MSAQAQTVSENLPLRKMANSIRALAMDAVQQANSGHPGMPMGMADVATVLYSKFMKFDASAPEWFDRDRFILSAGHGSMLLYALNYLTGYEKFTLDQVKNFRQLGFITAGHPEMEQDAGVEMTTGPLGQGISTAVGFALAERNLNARFGNDLINHFTYVMAGDGCLMEGISHESCSLAGHLKLRNLIVMWDDNEITIDGAVNLSSSEDVLARYEAYGWDVQRVDGHDMAAVEAAIAHAQTTETPSMIACRTTIGYGAPTKGGTSGCHGAPLGEEEIAAAREYLEWPHAPFDIPEDVLSAWRAIGTQGVVEREAWESRVGDDNHGVHLENLIAGDYADEIEPIIKQCKTDFIADMPKLATRAASGKVLGYLVPDSDFMIGGSADLTGSNNTFVKGSQNFLDANNYGGQYVNYGVREHAMAAMMNGMALHGGIMPYAGTFMSFADYSRPAIRLGALMGTRVVHVMTHDSIGLGEDGPTHQPVEHLSALRAIPNLYVFRPADAVETAEAWELSINKADAPSMLCLTRQGLKAVRTDGVDENKSARGAYILRENGDTPEVTLFATGSEVEIAMEAYDTLVAQGKKVRLVSVPCMELFWEQDGAYIQNLLCNDSRKIAIEAGIRMSWDRILGGHGRFIGMDGFGASAPADQLYKHFGITAEAVVEAANA